MINYSSISVLGMRVDMVQIEDVIKILEQWIVNKNFGNYIIISNANDAVISKKDARVREAVNKSSLSVPDGISLIIISRLLGFKLKRRVYGPDLMWNFLRYSEKKGYSHFFYGGSKNTLEKLVFNLKEKIPGLEIMGYYSPPFRNLDEDEDTKIIDRINDLSPDILWVGLGCPKQQIWMYKHKDRLKVPAMVGVGAAFDFIAGTKLQAPTWMRNNGLEWLFRFATEPKRLWRRYLVNGSLFIFYAGAELLKKCSSRQKT